MGNGLKLLALTAAFTVLIGIVFLLRREKPPVERPSPIVKPITQAESATAAQPIDERTVSTPETVPQVPLAPLPRVPVDSPRRGPITPDPATVKVGRREKADLDAILKAPSWEKFYELCKEGNVGGADYENVILRRLTAELGLLEDKATALKKLFKSEQESTTRSIIESSGGATAFERKKDEIATNSKAIFEEWRRQRDVIRRTQDAEYLKILTYSQLETVNEHLRNTEIFIETSYDSDGVHYLFSGVGKPPK